MTDSVNDYDLWYAVKMNNSVNDYDLWYTIKMNDSVNDFDLWIFRDVYTVELSLVIFYFFKRFLVWILRVSVQGIWGSISKVFKW